MPEAMRTAILISGRGSNMETLLKASASPDYPVEMALVLSNNPEAKGLTTASQAGIKAVALDHRDYADRDSFESALTARLLEAGIEMICLAGFMRLLNPAFVTKWHNRLINIHPSLLPAYKGLDTYARAIDAGETYAGCSVHYVRPEMDAGPIILQAAVHILDGDTPEGLASRVLAEEHRIYPEALKMVALGKVDVRNEKVVGYDPDAAIAALENQG